MRITTSFLIKGGQTIKISLFIIVFSITAIFGHPILKNSAVFDTERTKETNSQAMIASSDLDGVISSLTNAETVALNNATDWFFECGDDKRVNEYGFNANCNNTTTGSIPDPSSIYKYVVEIVYKGGNPGSTIQITDSSNNSHTLNRSVPFGSSSNIWVYRGEIQGSTSSVTYSNNNNTCQLQSLVVYAFRNVPGASGSSGIFTNRSGYNDVQTITIDIPTFTVPRNLIIKTPISEMTDDGRYLKLKASAQVGPNDFKTDEIFVYGPDSSLPGGSCCLTMPVLILNDVPGDVSQITLTIDTRHNQNGQSVNGQSWVIAAGVNVVTQCENNPDIALVKTGVFDDNNGNGVAEAGETITYDFTVTNTGQTTLYDITIEDPLVSVSGSLASLAAGASNNTAFSATYVITQSDVLNGFVENQAVVDGCFDPQPVDPNGNCSGQVNWLELEYQGNVINGVIKVIEHDGQTVFEGVVQSGERFDFYGMDPPQNTFGPKIDIYINNNFVQEIHTSCSQPIGPGAVFGDFEVIRGTSRNNGPLTPIAGTGCGGSVTDLSDDNSIEQDDPTVVPLPGPDPTPRDCNCSPLYKDSSFTNPVLESGTALQEGAVYRFSNVFPSNPHGTTIDALVRIEDFAGGASLLEIDVTSSGLAEAFQPRINSTNNLDQSVLFNITFVDGGGTYGDEVDIAFYATPLDIDGDGQSTREYAEVSLPDAYFVNANTVLNLVQTATVVRGTANSVVTAPGGDVSLDPRFTYSTYYETQSSIDYRIGKLDGNSDRYYSLNVSCADYDQPDSVIITYPVICGNVSDEQGNPLANVNIDVTGSDGSSQTVQTDASGNYKAIAMIPENLAAVTYEIMENDPPGYISISDVDGANDNLITRTIELESSCGNDFVDGIEVILELISKTDILCNGDNTGSITVEATGGLPPYTYTLNGGTPQASPTFNNLVAGVYTVGVEDSLGNTDSIQVTLTEPEPISIQITKMNATATGGCMNGTATANPTGGVGPYTYQWSASAGNQTTQTATNLPTGTHTVVVTDANNCTLEQGVVIDCVPNCDAVISVDNITHVLCTGDNTGSATVSASSALNPGATFTFTWNTVPPQIDAGVTSSTVSNLGAGVYTVSVTIDGTLCLPVEQSITITEPSNALNVTATSTDETGPTTGDGTATANPTGGTPPYTYLWSPGGQTTQTITGLSAGDYTVTVTDANGCTATATTTVNPGSCRDLAANASSTPVSCNGGDDGTATVGVTGGLGPFSYSWSPGGQTTQTITGLSAGVYTVTVTDQSTLCTATSTTTVNEPGALSSGIAVTNVLCYGDMTGSLDLTVTGGTPPYTFLWSPNGETTEDLSNLAAGTYSVVITDANGCTATRSATVMQPSNALSLQITSQTDIVCQGLGSVTVEASGGTPPYMYSLNGGAAQASGTFDNLPEGTYTVSVVDGNGCDEDITVSILANCTDAINDINNTYMDLAVAGNVLTNDEDDEGDNQIVTTTGTFPTTAGGSVTLNADGSYIYTPPAGYTGPDTFMYTIVDDGNPQATDSATVFIEVLPVGPQNTTIANADTAGTLVGTPVSGNVLINDFDPEGDNQVVTTVGTFPTTQGGSITIAADGSFTYTPPAGFTGEDTFEYFIEDDGFPQATDSAILAITVTGVPFNVTFANDDAYNGNQGATVTGNVLDNDTDPQGDTQTVDTAISPVSGPTNGTLTLNADGTFSYTPNDPTFFGTDQFVYEIFDNGTPVARDQATVIITIFGINTTDAINDINNTYMDLAVAGNVLTNDEDDQGDNQIVTTTGTFPTTAGGSVTLNADGSYIYTPPAGYTGPDTFMYTIVDDGNPQATDSATVFIEVLPVGPQNTTIANADTAGTLVDTPVSGNVLINDFDPEGDNQVVTTVGTFPTTQGGSITIAADGSFTYTPPAGFTGEDTFEYFIEDDGFPQATDSAILAITVTGVPFNVTFANDDAYNGNQGATVTGNVLDNDTDPQGDTQTVDTAISPVSGPTNGTLTLNADGTFSYTPNDPTFFGTDQFVYEIFDNGTPVARDQATVIITIFGENTILAIDDINNTYVDLPVSGSVATNDENYDGPAGTEVFTLVTGPANGILVFNPDGTYTYTPADGFIGEDTFDYQICDAGNPIACDTATVYIEVMPIGGPSNEPPVANADTNTTEMDTPVSGTVIVNDFDPDGDPIVVTSNTNPSNGSVVVNPDGSYTYTPDPGFTGEDTFQYTICDNGTPALCDSTIVTIQVIPNSGNITVANDDAYNGFVDTVISGNVLDNDNDPEGDSQTVDTAITPVSGPSNGSLSINADGSFTYTPNAGFFGTDQFVYAIFDNGTPVATDQATVYLTVGIPNNDILAVDDINDTYVDLPVSGSVATNDENYDGPAGTEVFNLITGPVNGSLVFNPDGTYTYTPDPGFEGEDTFEYQICDGGSPVACDTATVYIEVLPIGSPDNEPPVANADTNTTLVDVPVSGNVLVNDFDPDGDPIVVTSNTNPSNGTVVVNPDGSYTYTPDPGFAGEDTFQYTICDNGTPALCDTATVTIQVIPNNGNITVANDDAYNGFIDTVIAGNVLDNDNDPEGDSQTVDTAITPVSGPSNGTLAINADGSFTYTPNAGFFGTDQFVYEIFDNGVPVARDQATVYLTIGDPGNYILAIDDINDTFVNLAVSGDVSTNDVNTDGPAGTEVFTLIGGSGPSNGSLVFNPDGTYTYTPNVDFIGEDTFQYQVCDGGNPIACDIATVYIEVVDDPVIGNDPPVANADTNTTEVDTPVSGNALVNDFDPDGDPIVVTSNTNPSNGTVVMNPDGTYTYTPNPGFTGEDTFQYTICDNGTPALCDSTIVTIQVIPNTGNITVANDDAYYGEIDQPITANVLDNDTDPEGDNQAVDTAITPVSGPSNGSLAINADGTFTYTPNAGFIGTDQFVYEIFDDNAVEARDRATVYILIEQTPAPAIAIVKTGTFIDGNGNQCADPGEMIEYTFTVVNTGNVTLSDVTVTDPLVTVTGGPIVLTAGQTDTTSFTASYAITQADIDAGEVTNQATATGTDPDGTVVSDLSDESVLTEDDPTITVLCQNPAIAIVKVGTFIDGNGNQCADPGEMIEYDFTVVNTGNVTLSDVTVTDPLVTVTGGPIVLAPGQTDTTSFTASYAITQADIDAGEVINQATATGTAPDLSMVSDLSDESVLTEDDPTITVLCQNPSIAILKVGTFIDGNGNQCADPDEIIEYAFTVVNTGNVTLSDVTVTDPLVTVTGGPIVLAPGQTDTTSFTASYAITQADIDAGQVTNQATATGTAPDLTMVSDLSDESVLTEDDPTITELCQNASIALIKEGLIPPAPPGGGCPVEGDVIEYTFTVVNTGNQTLTNVTVTDPLVAVVGGPLATLPVGATDATTFTATYTLTQADVDAGFFENQATAEGTTPAGGTVSDLSDDEVVTEDDPTIVELCQTPIIALVKVGTFNDENGNGCADVKETISYAFTVYNLGNVTLNNIDVTDPLVNVQGGPISLPPLQTDATTFTASYVITQADIDAGEVINQATVTGTSAVGDTVSDISDESSEFGNDPTITVLCQSPVIALIKTGTPTDENNNGCVDLGETIVYDFVVTNLGNVTLTNVTVTDPLVDVVGGPITLAAGESDTETFSAIYTVTQDDVDAGSVSNQATAEGTAPDGTVVSDLSDENSNFEDDATITVLCQNPAIALEKTGVFNDDNGDGSAQVGETISYSFSVINIGNVTLYNIELTDELPGIIIEGGPIAQLLPGEVDDDTFTGTYVITQGDIDAGMVENQAVATGMDINGNEVSDTSDDPLDPTNVDPDGDGDPDDITVVILPVVSPPFEIFNGITPDGDGLNDFFNVFGIEEYPENNMKIFNRWGVLVWETDGYGGSNGRENVFEGYSDGRSTIRRGERLPTGTYYYVLTFPGDNPGKSSYSGYLYINR